MGFAGRRCVWPRWNVFNAARVSRMCRGTAGKATKRIGGGGRYTAIQIRWGCGAAARSCVCPDRSHAPRGNAVFDALRLGDFEVGCISVSAVVGVMGFAPYGRPTYFRESRQTVCSWLGASFVGLPSTPAPFRGHAVMGRPWPAWLSRLLPLIPLHDTCARPGALTSRSAVSGPWRKRIKIKSFGWTPPRSSTACRRGRPQDRPRRQAGLLRVNDLNLVGARLPAMALVHPTLFHRMYRPFAGKRAPTVPGMASALLRFRVWQDRSRRRAVLSQAIEACSFTSRSGLSSGVTPSITASTPNNNSYPNPYPPVTSLNTPKQIGPSAAIR